MMSRGQRRWRVKKGGSTGTDTDNEMMRMLRRRIAMVLMLEIIPKFEVWTFLIIVAVDVMSVVASVSDSDSNRLEPHFLTPCHSTRIRRLVREVRMIET